MKDGRNIDGNDVDNVFVFYLNMVNVDKMISV